MAIKMVREPSETPNINNIDDIIPMRYAYGGQNGFVIGKGTEISNTVSGLNFTVNSGRLVMQGVECDIDATGVTITIDNIATKRYYTVYLEVNLGLNTATIKSEYDTATYPTIDTGDDLTENSTGIARLPLYQFTATSGIISEVNKVVKEISYPLNDYDITKGTVEERLTNLGFKQGTVISSISTLTVPQNIFTRQGNYVLMNSGVFSTTMPFPINQDKTIGKVPEEFRPKEEIYIGMFDDDEKVGSPARELYLGTAIIRTNGDLVLKGFGGIFAYSALESVVGGSVINNYSKFSFKNQGWEANPLK